MAAVDQHGAPPNPNPNRELSREDFQPGPLGEVFLQIQRLNEKARISPAETNHLQVLEKIKKIGVKYLRRRTDAIGKSLDLGFYSKTRAEKIKFLPYSIHEEKHGDRLDPGSRMLFEEMWTLAQDSVRTIIEKRLERVQSTDTSLKKLLEHLRDAPVPVPVSASGASTIVSASGASTSTGIVSVSAASTIVAPASISEGASTSSGIVSVSAASTIVAPASISEATAYLITVLKLGSLCRRETERDCIIHHNPAIPMKGLERLADLNMLLSQFENPYLHFDKSIDTPLTLDSWKKRPGNGKKKEPSVKKMKKESKELPPSKSVEECINQAQEVVDCLPEVMEVVQQIKSSTYMQSDGSASINYAKALIGILWDFENLGIPCDRDAKNLVEKIKAVLKTLGYHGQHQAFGYGNMVQLGFDNFVKLVGSMDLIHVPDSFESTDSFEADLEKHEQGKGTQTKKRKKDTADKKLIPSGLTWARNKLLEFQEPQVVVICSNDVDYLPTIRELKLRGFHVVVFRNQLDNKVVSREATKAAVWSQVTDQLTLKIKTV